MMCYKMEIPKAIELYYKSPEKVKIISEQFMDYCYKNHELVYNIYQRIQDHAGDNRVALLVSGISGSTKTFFSELLGSFSSEYSPVHLDCFAVPRHQRKNRSTFLPENFDFEASFSSLDSIISDEKTDFPIYCHEDFTVSSNVISPAKSFVVEGIHSHHPYLVGYFKSHKFEVFKITLIASFKYLQDFKRREAPPTDEIIKKRINEYGLWVYPHSKDSFAKLKVSLDYVLRECEKFDE